MKSISHLMKSHPARMPQTPFALAVLAVVAKIPKGETMSYKEVARAAGRPKAARAVGNILNKNRNPEIPCHRVVKADGTPGGYAFGAEQKKEILERERS
jgi:O-6-methylguanine DNA methyltransferase